jgi:carbonic anhydrase
VPANEIGTIEVEDLNG